MFPSFFGTRPTSTIRAIFSVTVCIFRAATAILWKVTAERDVLSSRQVVCTLVPQFYFIFASSAALLCFICYIVSSRKLLAVEAAAPAFQQLFRTLNLFNCCIRNPPSRLRHPSQGIRSACIRSHSKGSNITNAETKGACHFVPWGNCNGRLCLPRRAAFPAGTSSNGRLEQRRGTTRFGGVGAA